MGVWTIGYGHTQGVTSAQKITQQQAEDLLKADLKIYESGVNNSVKVSINQNQFDALVSFAYNLGVGALQGSTLLKLLNQGDYNGAANEFGRWVYAGDVVLQGLVRRRAAEKALFLESISASVPPTIPTTEPTQQTGGEEEMVCLYQVDGKGAVRFFDGTKIHALVNPDELAILNTIYKDNTGKDIPFYNWTSAAPWHVRLSDAINRGA